MIGVARIILGIAAAFKGLLMLALVNAYNTDYVVELSYTNWKLSFPAGTFGLAVSLFWIIFAIFFTIGFGARLSGALLAFSIVLVLGIDQQFYSNHLYLLLTLVVLLTLAGPGVRYSVDNRRAPGDGAVPRWAVTLIMLQLTSVYGFAAITKLNDGFLSGRVMERAFDPAMLERVETLISLETLALLAIATELFLAVAFWHQRLQLVALPVAAGFHIANVVIMGSGSRLNLSIFALVMLSMMVVYFTQPGTVDEPAEVSGTKQPGPDLGDPVPVPAS